MYDWQNFDVVFQLRPVYTYSHADVERIRRRRSEFEGALFFDRIWISLKLDRGEIAWNSFTTLFDSNSLTVTQFYPPKSHQDLKVLWQKIAGNSAPDLQKQALLFYIWCDSKKVENVERNFADRVLLPERYKLFVMGLWDLDHGNFQRALENLTHPILTPTFTDDILYVLIQHPDCDNSLAMAYYIAISPPLRDGKTLHAYFELLTHNSVAEAFHFCQKHDPLKRRLLFEELIVLALSEKRAEARAERAMTLMALPFSPEEERWFEETLLTGKGSQIPQAKDTVLMRRIAMGRRIEGKGALERVRGQDINGMIWDDVRKSLQKAKVY